jgi:imidazolonepropionase-like amidohydrolase
VPDGCDVYDVSGLTIVPGLIDSHLHTVNDLQTPALFLAHGVTSFRDPGHPFRFYQAVMQAQQAMPRVFLSGGHLDAYPPIWPQEAIIIKDVDHARQTVHQHVDRGASYIKIYFRLPLEYYPTVCEAARQRGVLVTAHLELVDADQAIAAGVRGIEHITSFGTALSEPTDAAEFKAAIDPQPDMRQEWRYRLWAKLDLTHPQRVATVVKSIVDHEVFVSPTLAVFERRAGDADTSEMHVLAFKKMLQFVGICHRAGAKVVVGSHTSVPHAERGWAYQRELELLVEAGLTPLETIRAATLHNAEFFGAEDRLGSLQAGKAADLVLVKGDPAADIRAMYDIRRVMLNGTWVDPLPE